MVSHELRAPLTSIKGSAATLLETSPDLDRAEMREFHRIIAEQADHMRGLIGDLLDVGRIDAGTLSVSPEASEVAALVDRARNTFLSGGARHAVSIGPAAGPAAGDGRPAAHRPGAEQPVLQRLAARAGDLAHPGRRGARRRPCRNRGIRRGPGRGAGAAASPVPQAHRLRRRRRRGRARRGRARAGDLQGAGGGPWRAHPGHERRAGPGHPGHLHPAGGRGCR